MITYEKKTITIPNIQEAAKALLSNINENRLYLIFSNQTIIHYDFELQQEIFNLKIQHSNVDWDSKINAYLSPSDEFLAIVNDFGQYGFVIDLTKKSKVLDLDRKDYHTAHTKFPIAFIENNQCLMLLHATDWNHIDVTDLSTLQIITNRQNEYKTKHYIDYFYGGIQVSKNYKWMASSGWVWSPIPVFHLVNLHEWLNNNINEPEDEDRYGFALGEDWDYEFVWIDAHRMALIVDTKHDIPPDECEDYKVEKEKIYIFVYDFQKNEQFHISFEGFEGLLSRDYKLFVEDYLMVCSPHSGVIFIDVNTSKVIHRDNDLKLEWYNSKTNTGASLLDNNQLKIINFLPH